MIHTSLDLVERRWTPSRDVQLVCHPGTIGGAVAADCPGAGVPQRSSRPRAGVGVPLGGGA